MPVGFWGPPTASVDWCEQNYALVPWVCEAFNTVSSLAMVFAGALGLSRPTFAREVRVAFALLMVVGLGSIAFHATLRFELQMLDELPMLYLVTWLVWVLVENRPERRLGRWFPAALLVYVLLATAATLQRGAAQFLAFHSSFGMLEILCLGRVTWLALRPENAPVRRSFVLGLAAYAAGIAAWFVDLKACTVVSVTLPAHGIPNPQLHAWWHVLVSIGFFLLLRVVSFDRIQGPLRRGDRINEIAVIRQATPADAPGILDCMRLAFEAYRHRYTRDGYADTVMGPATIEQRLAAMTLFVATTGAGEIVGTIGCHASAAEGHIRGMAVHPRWQGTCVAQELLERAEAELRGRGCSRVTLDTTEPLRRAIRFYQRNGFGPSGKVRDFFGMPLFEYVKDLG